MLYNSAILVHLSFNRRQLHVVSTASLIKLISIQVLFEKLAYGDPFKKRFQKKKKKAYTSWGNQFIEHIKFGNRLGKIVTLVFCLLF